MRIPSVVLAAILLAPAPARAEDNNLINYLIGPVFGIQWGGPQPSGGVVGIEGGVGAGPVRGNLGFDYRADQLLTYIELDPWLLLGGTLGFGIDSAGDVQPVVGVWEGLPLKLPRCAGDTFGDTITLAVGYRYTGVHEIYATIKAGVSQPICF